MKPNWIRVLIYFVILVIGFGLGYVVSKYYNFPHFQLDDKFSLTDLFQSIIGLATLVATIFVAFYITEVLEKNQQINRINKDLLLRKIDRLEFQISEFEKLTNSSPIPLIAVTSSLKKLDVSVKAVNKAVTGILTHVTLKDYNDFRSKIGDIRQSVTYYPPTAPGTPPDPAYVTVNGGNVTIPNHIQLSVDLELLALMDYAFQFQIEVNNA